MRHGTKYGYDQGCRCAECRDAARARRRRYRALARERGAASYYRELANSRALKQSYRGTCEDCGASTDGSNGPGKAPPLCISCFNKAKGIAERGHGPVVEAVLKYLAKPRRFSEVRDHVGLTSGHTGVTLHRLRSYGLIERVERGVYVRTKAAA